MNAARKTNTAKSAGSEKQTRREKTAALRREAEARERRRQLLMSAVFAAIAVVIVGLIAFAVLGQDEPDDTGPVSGGRLAEVSGLGAEAAPPWPAPDNAGDRAEAAGMPLGPMGTAEHYHAHLDVIVDGQTVPVPANIGVGAASGAMAALHTHTGDGIIHVEASTRGQPFTLGQLFTEWNVKLSADQLGALKAEDGNTLQVYVNGKKTNGNPAMLRLAPNQQISVVYGPAGQDVDVPDSYDFEGM